MTATEFRNLMERAGRRMLIAALRVTGSQVDAEDAVQEAMCHLWKNRSALAAVANPEGYATVTARRCALDLLRLRRPLESLDNVGETPAESVAPEIDERFAAVIRIIDTLPSPQREVITQRDLQGLEIEQIQQNLNLTAVNVRVILSRARAAVRKRFSSYD